LLSFPNFLGHIMHFSKSTRANWMKTCFKPLQTYSSTITYWHALENACSKQVPW
jgi:hypothetical protein